MIQEGSPFVFLWVFWLEEFHGRATYYGCLSHFACSEAGHVIDRLTYDLVIVCLLYSALL